MSHNTFTTKKHKHHTKPVPNHWPYTQFQTELNTKIHFIATCLLIDIKLSPRLIGTSGTNCVLPSSRRDVWDQGCGPMDSYRFTLWASVNPGGPKCT